MDYYGMKRRELQALCKEHSIPGNSTNSVMADKLSQLLNEKQKPSTRQLTCLKSPIETPSEGEPAVSKREAKKLRFSPNNDLVEYELRSGKKHKDVVTEMKSVANKVDKQAVNDNNNTVELIDDGAQIPVKLTRSRLQVSGKDGVIPNNEKKQGRKAAKDVEKVTDVVKEPEGNLGKVTRSKVHTLNKGAVAQLDETKQTKRGVKDVEKTNESVEGTFVGSVRVTRSKAQSLMGCGIGSDVNPQLKKCSGRRVAKDAHSVGLSREITDIPVRITRTRGQILKEDIGNMVTNPEGEKKRTRREMKTTDLRINLRNVAPDDNQELPKRKSLRTRGVATADEDEAEKFGPGKHKKRSKKSDAEVLESQHHADKGSRLLKRNMAKVEDSKVLKQNVSKVNRKVTRSQHQRESKLVQQAEEPSDHGEKKDVNRRKSVMQKAQGKGIDKPLVGRRESLKETVMVESPARETRKTVGKSWSKEQTGNLSLIDEGLKDIENVARSGKDASENEIKAVVNATGSPKSRKRRGTPIIKDQTVETEHVSTVDESPRHSAPSSSKSEGKFVAKKQVESSLKTTASRKNNQLAVQNAFLEVKKKNSSKKRAKLSGTNQRYSEKHSEKSNTKGTSVLKVGNFELDEEVTETESTPAIESHRRSTRSAIRTVGKEPSQSAIKEQPIGDAQLSSQKVARFKPDPAISIAPGRVTRSGIRHGGKAAIIFSEKVDKKKQLSQSALRKQPLDYTQISSPEGAEVRLNPDVDTIGVQSEISKASESVKLPTIVLEENTVSMTGTAIVMENLSPVHGENASGVESHTISNIKRIPVTMAEKPEVDEATPNAVSNGSHLQKETQEVSVKSTMFSEAEVQEALNSEKPVAYENDMDMTKQASRSMELQIDLMAKEPAISVDKTVEMEENVDIPYEAGSSAVCHVSVEQSDVKGKSKEMEDQVKPSIIENVMQSIEDDGGYAQMAEGSEQDDLTCKDSLQNDSVDKHEVADNGEGDDEDDEGASVQKPLINEPVSEDRGVADGVDAQKMDESDNKEDITTAGQSVNEHGELSTGKSVNCLAMNRSDVADDVAAAGKDPTKKLELEVVSSTDNDVHEVPILGESDGKEDIVSAAESVAEHGEPSTGNDVHEIPIFGESENKVDIVSAGQGVAEHGELSTGNDVHEIPISGESDNKEDMVSAGQSVAEHGEMSTGVHEIPILGESDNKEDMVTAGQSVAKHGELLTGKNVIYGFSIDRSDVADDVVDAGKDPTKKLEFEVVPSTGNDVHEVPILGKSDGEDKGANVTKEGEIDSMPSTDGDVPEDPVLSGSDGDDGGPNAIDCDTDSLPATAANKLEDSVLSGNDGVDGSANATDCQIESLPSTSGNMIDDPVLSGSDNKAESKPKPLTDHDESDTSFLGKNDYINRQLEPTLELSPADDIIESPFSGNDIYDDVEADRGINVPKELETGLEPSNVPLSINDVSSDFENDQLPSNDSHAMDDHNVGDENSEPPPNENPPVVTEVSIRSCDQEPEHVFNVAADEVPCDAVGISASVGPFDSSTNIEASHTHGIAAITVGPLEESILDINKEAVSNIMGDTYDTYNENGSGNERKFTELDEGVQPKESESFYPDMSKEQTSEKAEMTTGIDNVLDDQEKHTVATVDHDLDGGKFLEDCSNHGVEELDSELVGIINADENPTREENSPIVQTKEYSSQVMGDIGAHESPITKGSSPITYTHEESPLDDTDSDSPTFFKEDDRNKQGSTTVDWGDYSFVMDEFHNPVTANESDDVLDKSRKEFQTSVGASSSGEENSRVADDMVNSVKNLEMASRNVANEKSSQEVDMLKENVNADMTEEVFNWSDSSLKSLLKTPAVTQLSHIKDGQEEGVSFSNQDHYSSLRYFFKTPARIGHVEYGQKDAVDFSNQDHRSSLKSLFTAPATARISHVKDDKENAGSFTFPDDRCNKDVAKNRPATHDFDHQWHMEPLGGFDGETQGNETTHSSETVMYVNIEDYSHKFFGDEVDDSSDDGSGKDKHFELKGDEVDKTKRFDLSSEAVGTSCYQASGVSDELEKKEETKLKGSEPFDDLDFDKGI